MVRKLILRDPKINIDILRDPYSTYGFIFIYRIKV